MRKRRRNENIHIQSNPGSSSELGLVNLLSAAHHISRATGSLDDETLVIQLTQDLTDHLTHALESLEILLGLVILFPQLVELDPRLSDTALLKSVVTQNRAIRLEQARNIVGIRILPAHLLPHCSLDDLFLPFSAFFSSISFLVFFSNRSST